VIEEIKLLLPLLEGVADGGFWIIITLIGTKVLSNLAGLGVLLYVVNKIYKGIIESNTDKLSTLCLAKSYELQILNALQKLTGEEYIGSIETKKIINRLNGTSK